LKESEMAAHSDYFVVVLKVEKMDVLEDSKKAGR